MKIAILQGSTALCYTTHEGWSRMDKQQSKVYWHEAFSEALQLELHQYRDVLEFQREFQLSKEALIMDLLVIKKKQGVRIDKNIGRIFRTHNIFEFKSEKDNLLIPDYNKGVGCGLLYSSFQSVPVADITLSFAVTRNPKKLLDYLQEERGFTVRNVEDGIRYVEGDTFPVQILESKKLSAKANLFLRNLRSGLNTDEAKKTTDAYTELKPFEARNVYLNRLIQANHKVFEEVLGMYATEEEARETIVNALKKHGMLAEYDREIAKKLLSLDVGIEKIIEATGLSRDVVVALA